MRASLIALAFVAVSTAALGQTAATFTPDHFFNTFSGAHPPALRIKPGERVITKTIDAAGADWNGKQVASGPNPQTGPFWLTAYVLRLHARFLRRPPLVPESEAKNATHPPRRGGGVTDASTESGPLVQRKPGVEGWQGGAGGNAGDRLHLGWELEG